jgi:hypothetical protein
LFIKLDISEVISDDTAFKRAGLEWVLTLSVMKAQYSKTLGHIMWQNISVVHKLPDDFNKTFCIPMTLVRLLKRSEFKISKTVVFQNVTPWNSIGSTDILEVLPSLGVKRGIMK